MEEKQPRLHQKIQWLGLVAGPVAAAIVYCALPDEFHLSKDKLVPFSHAGRVTLAVMVWMATWWLTEALHISITALLPLLLFPILGAAQGSSATARMKDAAAPYADPMVFLFMGGFMVALSMQRWGLDRRFALMTLRLVGSKPANMIGGVMLATAVLSAFVSNTATTAMMLPIALSVIALVRRQMGNSDQSETRSRKSLRNLSNPISLYACF
jgi:sodium-dependent dicarboxylate transporter 2/3/5